jgi:hypothetical protein
LPNVLRISRRERAPKRAKDANDLAREAVGLHCACWATPPPIGQERVVSHKDAKIGPILSTRSGVGCNAMSGRLFQG